MEEEILKILSKKEMRVGGFKEKIKDEKLNLVLKEMEDSGLIFLKKNQNYSITLLGKFLSLGLKETYESIVEKEDLFDFFRTRIPSATPDELLAKFKFCEDFQILGKPDLVERGKEILNKAISMQPYAEKDMCISAPLLFKPGVLHGIAVLKKGPKTLLIIPGTEYEKNKTLINLSKKFINLETKVIDEKYHYMGLLYVDGISCFFGFCDLEDKPGWDAIIYTENKECIEWVKENFDYMWDNLARKP
jgi:predicted transcriptional regulator